MLIAGFPAGPWGTNCYVVATGPGAECVVIDPGKDAAAGVAEVVREHRLKPVAVLVTHGHVDHMWCVAPVAGDVRRHRVDPPGDRHLLTDPMAGHVAARPRQMLLGGDYSGPSPTTSASWPTCRSSSWPGCSFVGRPHPGPHRGLGDLPDAVRRRDDVSEVMFSGDLLFAGSIGRTDLPGGDHPTMLRSLRHQGAAAAPTTSSCCPATASRPPSAASAPPTRSCRTSPTAAPLAESPEDSDP